MRTPQDPVSAFFSGFTSGFSKLGFVLFATGAGALISTLSQEGRIQPFDLWFWIPLMPAMFFWWMAYGAWAFFGLLAAIGLIFFSWLFSQDHSPSASFFGVFASSFVYYLPRSLGGDRWHFAIAIFLGCALLYWGTSWYLSRSSRNA